VLSGSSHEAAHVLEGCLAEHHVAEVDYTDADGHRSTIRIRPAFIRHNSAGHVVLWGIPMDRDDWEELRLDRIHSVRDTGEAFSPTW
jgi:predicted DNA-binding transcriptional regulator YafY